MRCTRSSTSPAPGSGGAASRISIFPGAVITACFTTSPHALEPAAIDGVGRPGAVARSRRAKVDEQIGHLFGRGETPNGRIVFGDLFEVLLPSDVFALRQLFGCLDPVAREHEARIDAIDADVLSDELVGQ